jgi:hypothetical protein
MTKLNEIMKLNEMNAVTLPGIAAMHFFLPLLPLFTFSSPLIAFKFYSPLSLPLPSSVENIAMRPNGERYQYKYCYYLFFFVCLGEE